jgi:hypothetical protein
MQAFGWHLRGTTANVETVDHHDIEVGRWPVGASADQVHGIQKGSGSQAGERMGALQRHGCGGRRRCCKVKQPSASGCTCTGTWAVVRQRCSSHHGRGRGRYSVLWGYADKKRGKQARWLQGYGKGETFNGRCSARDSFMQDYCTRIQAEDAAPPRQP